MGNLEFSTFKNSKFYLFALFAAKLKLHGVKILYYVAPQAWAWKANRAVELSNNVHTLFTILPFEKEWFSTRGVKQIKAVTHPLVLTFKDEFSHSDLPLGYSMRVSEVSSVIMRQQLKKLDLILKNLRDRKRIFVQELKSSQLQMILPQDLDGDCSTHLHFKFEDPLIAKEWAKKLTDQGILAYPLYVRPAYCFWQWIKFLELTKNQEEKAVIEFSENRFFLSSVVKVDIKYDESLESTTEMALSLKKFAKSICS